ncbi:meiotic recombination protein SPO11 isoform X2 [Petromyzon marinus]|uniref:meiotic recombination protein SPO11 isoform X2 n=1 Tax=Petromyzon marinus TaxID=7757 RepID=UPI003F72D3D1
MSLPRLSRAEGPGVLRPLSAAGNDGFFAALDQLRLAQLRAVSTTTSSSSSSSSSSSPQQPAFVSTRRLGREEVLRAIEDVAGEVLASIARKQAPSLSFVYRHSWATVRFNKEVGLQMLPELVLREQKFTMQCSMLNLCMTMKVLHMIYNLVQTNQNSTKRDLYYQYPTVFRSQTIVNNIVDNIACLLRVPRDCLHVQSTSKGCVAGNLCYIEEDGTKISCTCSSNGMLVSNNVHGMHNLTTQARFVLVVEKDATFQHLLDDDFCKRFHPCIMVTGKGIPDLNTRLLVRKLWDTFHIPTLALVDADPHGFEIMTIYKYGSLSMSFDAANLTVPTLCWLGVLPSEIERWNIPTTVLLPLSDRDQRKLRGLLGRPFMELHPEWRNEVDSAGYQSLVKASAKLTQPGITTGMTADRLI